MPFPSPGELPDAGIEARYPALQADALTSESAGKTYSFKIDVFPADSDALTSESAGKTSILKEYVVISNEYNI